MAKPKPKAADIAHIVAPLRPLAIPVDSIKPDPENARLHPDRNVATIKESIEKKGFDQPVVVREEDMVLSKGHGRLQAIKELGHKWIAAVVVPESRVSAVEHNIADNRASDLAENDDEKLAKLLDFVTQEGGNVIGWDDSEMADVLLAAEEAASAAANEAEAPQQETVETAAPGDGSGRSVPGVVYKADIVFDDAEQQGRWHAFVRKMRKMYPDLKTIGARLDKFVADHADL